MSWHCNSQKKGSGALKPLRKGKVTRLRGSFLWSTILTCQGQRLMAAMAEILIVWRELRKPRRHKKCQAHPGKEMEARNLRHQKRTWSLCKSNKNPRIIQKEFGWKFKIIQNNLGNLKSQFKFYTRKIIPCFKLCVTICVHTSMLILCENKYFFKKMILYFCLN